MKQYWLMKSEPESYGIEHLKRDKRTSWNGVRNFQARNYTREMRIGDQVLFYHSNCKIPGVYGVAKVVKEAYPDPTQFDPKSDYYDKCATEAKPIWDLVDIAFVKKFREPFSLAQIRLDTNFSAMTILQPGSRLSVTPVTVENFEEIINTNS